jgi:predicted neutral ceramidase superfamily lipid hydrolase
VRLGFVIFYYYLIIIIKIKVKKAYYIIFVGSVVFVFFLVGFGLVGFGGLFSFLNLVSASFAFRFAVIASLCRSKYRLLRALFRSLIC